MGLTVHYNWKIKADLAAARRLIVKFHAAARKLPFDSVSAIYEQDPPPGKTPFRKYDHDFRQGSLYLPRKRGDGQEEVVHVPALGAVFFFANIKGAETAAIGLASHPPVVVHREEIIETGPDGICEHRIGQGAPVEFPTRRRGWFSWQSFCKTQYAGNPKLGGEANFLKAHLTLIELLDQIHQAGPSVKISDESGYARHRDVNRLLRSLRDWDAIIARVAGRLGDAIGNQPGALIAPIKDRPDFEHLEAKGIKVLKKLAARHRKRKKG